MGQSMLSNEVEGFSCLHSHGLVSCCVADVAMSQVEVKARGKWGLQHEKWWMNLDEWDMMIWMWSLSLSLHHHPAGPAAGWRWEFTESQMPGIRWRCRYEFDMFMYSYVFLHVFTIPWYVQWLGLTIKSSLGAVGCGKNGRLLRPKPTRHRPAQGSTAWDEGNVWRKKQISGWWLGHPSEKYESQLGWLATQYFWENEIDVPNSKPPTRYGGFHKWRYPKMDGFCSGKSGF